jgi:hypothetical protein
MRFTRYLPNVHAALRLAMKMYSYLVEDLPLDQWGWTVFGGDSKVVRSGATTGEHAARLAAMQAIYQLKKQDDESERRG